MAMRLGEERNSVLLIGLVMPMIDHRSGYGFRRVADVADLLSSGQPCCNRPLIDEERT
jgi:hypothetical protein